MHCQIVKENSFILVDVYFFNVHLFFTSFCTPLQGHVCLQSHKNHLMNVLISGGPDVATFRKSSSFLSFHQESCPLNCALPMPGTADGDVVSRCQVLGRAGSVHHGADQ